MQDDASLYTAMKKLCRDGLLFVTGIPDNDQGLVRIATRMGPMKDTFYGLTWDGTCANL